MKEKNRKLGKKLLKRQEKGAELTAKQTSLAIEYLNWKIRLKQADLYAMQFDRPDVTVFEVETKTVH